MEISILTLKLTTSKNRLIFLYSEIITMSSHHYSIVVLHIHASTLGTSFSTVTGISQITIKKIYSEHLSYVPQVDVNGSIPLLEINFREITVLIRILRL